MSEKSSTFAKSLLITIQIMEYSVEILDLVENPNCQFYKLLIDDECQFDEFVKQVEKVKAAQ